MGRRAHAPTDLYVRSGDTSGLIVIIAHASVNARRPRVHRSDQYFVDDVVGSLLAAPGLRRADLSVCLSVSVRCRWRGVIFATQCSTADAASHDNRALSDV